jgi:PLAT/LH2 domain
LGPLQFLRIWHDNSGIREMQPWYLSYVIIHDIQTGEKYRNSMAAIEQLMLNMLPSHEKIAYMHYKLCIFKP